MISGIFNLRGGTMISLSCTFPLLGLACLGNDVDFLGDDVDFLGNDVDLLGSSPVLPTFEIGTSFFDTGL